MVLAGLKDQDSLDRASSFSVWKAKIFFLLEENGLKEYVTSVIAIPKNLT